MRDIYHDELDDIGRRVLQMINMVASAMQQATEALLQTNVAVAEKIIGADRRVDALRSELEDRAVTLIAQQQPVATDLRVLISTMHAAGDLERMGDLAHHVAMTTRRRYPAPVVPDDAREIIREMGRVAGTLTTDVAAAVAGRDVELARAIETQDDSMDALQRSLFAMVLAADWAHGTEAAIDMTQIGRHYERYADHAVALARRTVFIVTGVYPRVHPSPYDEV